MYNYDTMTLEISAEDLDLIVTALEHYHAYTVAKNAEDSRYQNLVERLKRKPTERESTVQPGKPAKRRA